jgi:hypothetical protein
VKATRRGPYKPKLVGGPRARVCAGCVRPGRDLVLGLYLTPGPCGRCGAVAPGKVVEELKGAGGSATEPAPQAKQL